MDLLSILPSFSTKPYTHILPSLEKNKITTVDLITLDTLEIAKRAHVPPTDVRRLAAQVIEALHHDIGFEKQQVEVETANNAAPDSSINPGEAVFEPGPSTKLNLSRWNKISTLDPALDALVGGGLPTGYVTEITGESGSGKTQFLLSLLLAVQLPQPRGLGKAAIYISTEAALATPRLSQLLEFHPYLSALPPDSAPSLENVLSINAMDLESQDHILNYQLPVAITRYNVGLVVIDSITSNYRAEHSSNSMLALSARSSELAKLGQMLRNLAVKEDIAIVVANQVSDRFDFFEGHSTMRLGSMSQILREPSAPTSPLPRGRTEASHLEMSQNSIISSSSPGFPSSPQVVEDEQFDGSYLVGNPVRNEILSLMRQQRFFTGWGDVPQDVTAPTYAYKQPSNKTPALGFVWSTQIACRIALKKEEGSILLEPMPRQLPEQKLPERLTTQEHPSIQEATAPQEAAAGARLTVNAEHPYQSLPPAFIEKVNRRTMKLVFAPWTAGSTETTGNDDEVDFEIWKGGLRSVPSGSS